MPTAQDPHTRTGAQGTRVSDIRQFAIASVSVAWVNIDTQRLFLL
jgi:hypothetical protein